MNFILSIFLCLAMAFGGVSELPAEPETATTWTIRNMTVTANGESATFSPEVRLTTAVGEQNAALHFELADGQELYFPISLDVTPEALRLALTDGNRAYRLSDDALNDLLDQNDLGVIAPVLDASGRLLVSYGALIGAMRDETKAMDYSTKIMQALIDSCGGEAVDAELELDGQTLPAQRMELNFTQENLITFLDALQNCGVPELADMLDTTLAIGNLTSGTNYTSFAEAIETEGDMPDDFRFPLTITVAQTAELGYTVIESSLSGDGEQVMTIREDVITRGDQTDVTMNMRMGGEALEDNSISYDITAQMTGPANAPTALHMEYDMEVNSTNSVYDGESTNTSVAARMTLDGGTINGLRTYNGMMTFDSNGADVTLQFGTADRREGDGIVTGVQLSLSAEEQSLGLDFDLSRSEAAPVDYFDGAQVFDITMDALDSDEVGPLQMALVADISQLSLDGTQLAQHPSVLALQELIENWGASVAETMVVTASASGTDSTAVGGNGDDAVPSESDVDVVSFNVPAYTPPEGYVAAEMEPDEEYGTVTLNYENAAEDKHFSITVYPAHEYAATKYICADGSASLLTSPIVETYPMDDGTVYSAYVTMPDGAQLTFVFDDAATEDELCEILAGLTE